MQLLGDDKFDELVLYSNLAKHGTFKLCIVDIRYDTQSHGYPPRGVNHLQISISQRRLPRYHYRTGISDLLSGGRANSSLNTVYCIHREIRNLSSMFPNFPEEVSMDGVEYPSIPGRGSDSIRADLKNRRQGYYHRSVQNFRPCADGLPTWSVSRQNYYDTLLTYLCPGQFGG